MPRKFLYILTILLAALSLTITACETDEDEDATDSTAAGGTTAMGGTAAGGAAMGGTGTGGTTPQGYRFVRVTDTSGDMGGDAPGADIDAIGVRSASTGTTQWAANVEGNTDGLTGDPTSALGEPDAFQNWAMGDLSECDTDETGGTFVSLGGSSAIAVSFTNEFSAGDTIEVYEIGECDSISTNGVRARAETVSIEVAVAGDISTAQWQIAVQGGDVSPLITATVP